MIEAEKVEAEKDVTVSLGEDRGGMVWPLADLSVALPCWGAGVSASFSPHGNTTA